MKWASVDPFLLEDSFWQQKMGMPVANEQFISALLQSDVCDSYRFYHGDATAARRLRARLIAQVPEAARQFDVLPETVLPFVHQRSPADIFHNGDFTYYMPYLIEWRNGLPEELRFPITGVTHSLDTAALYAKFTSLLLAEPKPYDAVVCTSRAAVEMLSSAFQTIREALRERTGALLPALPRLVHIPLGIPERTVALPYRQEARKELRLPVDHVLILCFGRFSPRSKMDLGPFVEGFAWLLENEWRSKGLKVSLVLAGAAKKAELQRVSNMVHGLGIANAVHVFGNVNNREKDFLFAAADIFCSLVDNYQETYGLTILEAMEAGLPIIASDFSGYRDLIVNGEMGFLIPTFASISHEPWESLAGLLNPSLCRFHLAQKVSFDMDCFLRCLNISVCQPELRTTQGVNARRRAEAYRWPRVIQGYGDLWRDLVDLARLDHTARRHPSGLLTPPIGRIFRRHPTHSLREDQPLRLSGYGRSRWMKGFQAIRHEELEFLLLQEVLQVMVKHVLQRSARWEELIAVGVESFQLPPEISLLHVEWLLKHGILVPEKNANVPPSLCRLESQVKDW